MSKIKFKCAVLFVTPAALMVALCAAWSPLRASRMDDARKLLEERRDVLQQVVELQRATYHLGETKFDSVLLAHKELIEAELELAERPAQRIEIYEQLVKTMQEMEDVSLRRNQAGQASQADYLRSKAVRLKAQADLIREQDRGSK